MSSPWHGWDRQVQFALVRTGLHSHSWSSRWDAYSIGTELAVGMSLVVLPHSRCSQRISHVMSFPEVSGEPAELVLLGQTF